MSEVVFNADAIRHLTDDPTGKIARHIKKKTDELTVLMRDEAFKIPKGHVPRARFDVMITNTPIAASTYVIGVVNQPDPRGRPVSLTQNLANKAEREKAGGEGWMLRGIREQRYFKRV